MPVSPLASLPLSSPTPTTLTPRIIIHGGAGNITPSNLPPPLYGAHRAALLSILHSTATLLAEPSTTALDAATHAVTLLEHNPLYNAGRGAVFTTAGRIEHEASVMVSTPHPPTSVSGATLDCRKRAVGVMGTSTVKHPVLLAKELLLRGGADGGGGAQGHVQIHGETAERLARRWGLEMVRPSWAWSRKRWEQHRRGLGLSVDGEIWRAERREVDREAGFETEQDEDGEGLGEEVEPAPETGLGSEEEGRRRMREGRVPAMEDCGYAEEEAASASGGWNGTDYLPQGTVGAVVLDRYGTIAVATSTGGMTNKLPGRIGDTPTIGAGFWAESWDADSRLPFAVSDHIVSSWWSPFSSSPLARILQGNIAEVVRDWLPEWLPGALFGPRSPELPTTNSIDGKQPKSLQTVTAVGMSGTGNGDSFLRLNCVRTVAAMLRYSHTPLTLQRALSRMAGLGGLLQDSAEDRWGKTGEGEGGIIGIELHAGESRVVSDFNCGGMFRTWIDDEGTSRMMVFKDEYREAVAQ